MYHAGAERGESLKFAFPAAIEEDPPPEWIFWPSGNCEPAVVSYRGRDGGWTANYSPLTARAEIVKLCGAINADGAASRFMKCCSA